MQTTACLLAALFVLSPAAGAQSPPATEASAEQISSSIDAYLAPFLEQDQISGTVLVARGDEILFEKAYGMANHEHGAPNQIDTPHGIASISKGMTLVIGIRLLEQQKLAPTDTLDRGFPDFPRADTITVMHLVQHRAGIPHRVTAEDGEAVPRTAADMVALAQEALQDESAFLCDPGKTSNYSSAGYAILARVLELATGKTYDQLLQEIVCEPAGMTRTVHVDNRTLLPGRAESYMPGATGLRKAPLKDLSFLVGGGSNYSTASDLFRFLAAIRKETYGPSVKASMLDARGITWNGASNGFRAFADYHLEGEVSVVVTANLTTGALDRLRQDLPRIGAGETVAPSPPPAVTAIELEPEVLASYQGMYQMRPGSTMKARVEAGDFIVGSYVLVPTGKDRFFSWQDYSEVTVQRDEDGAIESLDWGGTIMKRVRAEPRSKP